MTAMTLGEMFPELNNLRSKKNSKVKCDINLAGLGTAERLKILYPEIESWDGFYISKMWMLWEDVSGTGAREPVKRDEQFIKFVVNFIHKKMLEIESGIKKPSRVGSRIDAAFHGIRQNYLDNEKTVFDKSQLG